MVKKAKTLKDLQNKGRKDGGEKQSITKKNNKDVKEKETRDTILDNIDNENKKTKLKVGRPTKYTKHMPKLMLDYFKERIEGGYFEEYTTEEFVGKNGVLKKKINTRPKAIPTASGFAVTVGVDETTLINWCIYKNKDGSLKHPDFFKSYRVCMSIQKTMLQELGLLGYYNSNIVKLLLSSDHDIYERIMQENKPSELSTKKDEINSKSLDDELQELYEDGN